MQLEKGVHLYLHNREEHLDAIGQFVQQLPNKKGIIVCSRCTHPHTVSKLTSHSIRTDRLFFIDCISKAQGKTIHPENNAIHLSHPDNIHELKTAIQTLSARHNYVVFDDLAMFLHHTTPAKALSLLCEFAAEKPVYVFSKQQSLQPEIIDWLMHTGKVFSEKP